MMIYLLQVSTCWILFYAIYLLFLRKETFFSINRYYLMTALVGGLVIPFLGGFLPENQTSVEVYQVMHQVSAVEITSPTQQEESVFTWLNFMYLVYIMGAAIVLARFIYGLSKIYGYYASGEKTIQNNYILVESDKYHLPFSFFKCIFISKKLPLSKDAERILKHEELHADQWHSLDIVLLEILQVFFWFNPILIFYKKSLKQSHEYLADAYVTRDHNRSSYGQLLLRQSSSGLEIALANHFFHSQIKQRITMMYKEKSKRQAMVKYLFALPVLLGLLIVFASSKTNKDLDNFGGRKIIQRTNPIELYNKDISGTISVNAEADEEGNMVYVEIHKDKTTITNKEILKYALQIAKSYKVEPGTSMDKGVINFNIQGGISNEDLIQGSKDLFGAKKSFTPNQDDPIFRVVEEMPRFPGCEEVAGPAKEKEQCSKKKMLEFIYQNLKYPKVARDAGIEGMCVVRFIVEKDGSISSAKMARDIGAGCGDESLKVVNSMPTWIPGKQQGQVVRVQYTLPIKFKLTSDEPAEPKVVVVGHGIKKSSTDNVGNSASDEYTNKGIELGQNTPNPWRETTYIPINVDEATKGHLTMYNVAGQEVFSKDLSLEKGMNNIQVSKKDIGEKFGIYYYQLTSRDYKKTMKTVLIEKSHTSVSNLNDEVFKLVEKMPRFPGCEDSGFEGKELETCSMKKMLEYVYTNIKYPKEARLNGVEGTAIVQMIIEKDGSVTNSQIIRNPGAGTGAEAKRVVDNMPDWIPGMQNGKAVRVQYTLPIKYKLEGPSEESIKNKSAQNIKNAKHQMPLFPETTDNAESKKALIEFVANNIRYPKEAAENNIEKNVYVKFEVNAEGTIQNVKIEEPVGWGFDEIVLEMMEKMKEINTPWTVPQKSEKDKTHEITLPVRFKLPAEETKKRTSRVLDVQNLSVSPNPTNGLINISFDLEDKSPAQLIIYSINGQMLKKIDQIKLPYESKIDLSDYKGQTVFLNVIQKDKRYTHSVIVN